MNFDFELLKIRAVGFLEKLSKTFPSINPRLDTKNPFTFMNSLFKIFDSFWNLFDLF